MDRRPFKPPRSAGVATCELWQISRHLARHQPATGLDVALEWAALALFLPLALLYPLWRRYRRGKAARQGASI